MLVATAICGSIPKAIKTGTVMSDVAPVTTLTQLVKKKTAATMSSLPSGTRHRIKAVRSASVTDVKWRQQAITLIDLSRVP